MFRFGSWLGGVVGALLAFTSAFAQDGAAGYPNKPIHIIVPFAAGGATDVTARIVGQKLAEEWGASVVIENRDRKSTRLNSSHRT